MTIAHSTIRGNDSGHNGGGISAEGGVVTILRSTLAGNVRDGGGALTVCSAARDDHRECDRG